MRFPVIWATISATRRQCAGCPAGMGCPVGQNHVPLAPASLPVGLGALVADKGLGVGLRQPCGQTRGISRRIV